MKLCNSVGQVHLFNSESEEALLVLQVYQFVDLDVLPLYLRALLIDPVLDQILGFLRTSFIGFERREHPVLDLRRVLIISH